MVSISPLLDEIAMAGGPPRGGVLVHVHTTGQDCRATGMNTGEAARRFQAWLAADVNPALTKIIQAWLWLPACSGGPGELPVSAWDVARLRAEILAAWPQALGPAAPQGPPGEAPRRQRQVQAQRAGHSAAIHAGCFRAPGRAG